MEREDRTKCKIIRCIILQIGESLGGILMAERKYLIKKRGKVMSVTELIVFLAIGAVAGWLAGILMKSRSSGLIVNIIIGVVGAFVGGFVFGALGVSTAGLAGSIVTATVGAVLLLFVVKLIKKV